MRASVHAKAGAVLLYLTPCRVWPTASSAKLAVCSKKRSDYIYARLEVRVAMAGVEDADDAGELETWM